VADVGERGSGSVPAPRASCALGAAVLAALTLAMFGDLLLGRGRVVSRHGLDGFTQYVHWRQFGFSELAKGNLALWNPWVFSGIPFLGGFQSALLYPPNWLHLVLPLDTAINAGVALHVFLMGLFTYLWVRARGLGTAPCLLAAVMMMFGGPFFLHVYPGHLSNLGVMPWVPLVLLCIDGVLAGGGLGWCLLGSAAVAAMVLAGHPQYVFYAGVTAAIYVGLSLGRVARRGRVVVWLLVLVAGAAALAAVQLLTGLDAARASVRAGGVSYRFAGAFSFPPENLLTLFAPGVLGDMLHGPYWGRCYLWEMSLFVGVGGAALAGYGLLAGPASTKRCAGWMLALLFVLALGAHTPLFPLLYGWVPGFDRFRGMSKFIFFASLFVALLAAVGLDELMRGTARDRRWIAATAAVVVLLALGATAVRLAAPPPGDAAGWWQRRMLDVLATGESQAPERQYRDPALVRAAALAAARGLGTAAAMLALVGAVVVRVRRPARAGWMLLALTLAQLLPFASLYRPTFALDAAWLPRQLTAAYAAAHEEQRVLDPVHVNAAMVAHVPDVWGFDPGVSRRYAEFMAATQGGDPDDATQYLRFVRREPFDRVYAMLRLGLVYVPRREGAMLVRLPSPLPHLQLVQQVEVERDRDAILAALARDDFDPRRTVVLEERPDPAPAPGPVQGRARVVDESSDTLTIEAEVDRPSILLVTDGYDPGWRARALPGSVQHAYRLLAANYVLRAIPLAAGTHRLVLEYRPGAFIVGRWISSIALIGWLAAAGWWVATRPRVRGTSRGADAVGG
jgi:hypothetical protein